MVSSRRIRTTTAGVLLVVAWAVVSLPSMSLWGVHTGELGAPEQAVSVTDPAATVEVAHATADRGPQPPILALWVLILAGAVAAMFAAAGGRLRRVPRRRSVPALAPVLSLAGRRAPPRFL